jgi:arylsulfatase A-like enzyme
VNIILVLIDSLNRHHLAAYGSDAAATPNFSAFAQRAWRMDNHFVGSLPCMPARREIFSGRQEFMWRPWGPLEPFDQRLPKLVGQQGYTTAIVTDHYHYWEEAANGYVQSFSSTDFVRGHELDNWKPLLADDEALPPWIEQVERWRPGQGERYYANVRDFQTEEDFFPAKVMRGASSWLHEHAGREPFFLQVESFDVHEPFHSPEPYASL